MVRYIITIIVLITNNRISTFRSSSYEDELAWGAAWLYRATGEQEYLDRANEFGTTTNAPLTYDWDEKTVGYQVDLRNV